MQYNKSKKLLGYDLKFALINDEKFLDWHKHNENM